MARRHTVKRHIRKVKVRTKRAGRIKGKSYKYVKVSRHKRR